jgi:plastocyanin
MGDSTSAGGGSISRRGFIRATGATASAGVTTATIGVTSATAGVNTATVGAASAQAQTYRFGGETQAWQGRAPSAIEGQENPTLELEAGRESEIVWENLDGAPHDFTIQDSEGTNLEQSEQIDQQGETASLTYTATPEMAQYICTIHPNSMVGDIEVSGGAESDGSESEDGTGLPLWSMLMLGAVVLAFVSPLLFALFLFSRRRESGETTRR